MKCSECRFRLMVDGYEPYCPMWGTAPIPEDMREGDGCIFDDDGLAHEIGLVPVGTRTPTDEREED